MNHIGGMLISPDSCDNHKLWCKSRLYPAILSAEIISFYERCSEMQFRPDPFLSVSILFSFSCSISLSLFQHGHGREGWVLCTHWRGVCIPVGLSILFLSSPPPAPVSSCVARTLPLALHLPPLSYPSSGHIPEPTIARVREMLPGGLSQPTTLPNNEPSAHDDAQAGLPFLLVFWYFFPLLLHLACLELQT